MHTEGTILKLISGGERLILDACDGKRTIVTAKKFFATGLLDPNFRKWGTNKTSKPTPETDVLVYEMERNATFAQIFSSLGDDINQLCFTQHQIINFIEKHSSWLRIKGDGIFFLFKVGDDFFIADVYLGGRGGLYLYGYLHHFEDDMVRIAYVWDVIDRRRVVVPL
ncbi:hypothetical protein COU24_00050 [Candidatus Kuenenbacteria bacterium CG10_big_fil_rev_8_21_14_0_10_39_14]|uniref:Uncharacterized protein n=4 Tax=Candidatus Kueneniibacteriota TaxID=1752740 RepID=A0A2H0D1W0_9BACT|nr:MAG: hypothetical protein AUK13_02220 [Candidatus Kuenenbacteria bacterium CG2_30_39_24]PIP28884.1 MAG: hypothetical protein COX28_02170 [Candidatus Kuenenbacteria bacterium CG23_combo_of_CG06-09_8_20_14_all_39_39]PIP75991.1 MAG: hypothetical protein COW86_00635 [Candidatus Kuenenbacteria bacterium CG22_combo_CG10-13_8_21_14_all_39_9]PIR81171.1 MAG: hypothetical protein COU24_00050 [Candidatus Kuenenbacteria bacterium CG10_big_fil_rev_8_21_14_0_10_39_14]